MRKLQSRITRRSYRVLLLAVFPAIAGAADVRIVTYNIQDDVSSPTPTNALPQLATVMEGIGQQQYVDQAGVGILKLPDVIAVQETTNNTTSVAPLVTLLNSHYTHPGLYNYSSYQATTYQNDSTVGGGPNALIYNQTTMNLLASVGIGPPQGPTNGVFRQVVRYEFQPVYDAGTGNGIFYVYDSHMKSGSAGTQTDGTTDGNLRYLEAQTIRNDEAANLPASAAVIYLGDLNGGGTTETAYQTLTSSTSPMGVSQGGGIDPLNPTNVTTTWGSSTVGILTESDDYLDYRDDLQLLTGNVFNGSANNISYVPGSFHAFGNNGTTAYKGNVISGSNTALNDINGHGPLSSTTVLSAMNNTIGSDHLPVVADYSLPGFNNGIWIGGTGTWSNITYWTNEAVPNTATLAVEIDNSNSTASVVTLDQFATVASVALDANDSLILSSGNGLTLAGPAPSTFNGTLTDAGTLSAGSVSIGPVGSFTLANGAALNVTSSFTSQGNAVFSGLQNWSSGSVFNNSGGTATFNTDAGNANASTLTLNNLAGAVILNSTQHLAGLNIASGALVRVTTSSPPSVLLTSSIAINGTLDLTNNALDVSGSSLSAVNALVQQGYNVTGNWNGSGITSSTAAGDTAHLTALGIVQNNQSGTALFTAGRQLEGITPGPGDVLVKYTWYGDTNLDGTVDGSDYTRIDNGYLSALTGWFNGDFNYDGVIDGSDYTLIDNAFNTQGTQISGEIASFNVSIADQIAGPAASVPEPTGALIVVLAAGLISRRRNVRGKPFGIQF